MKAGSLCTIIGMDLKENAPYGPLAVVVRKVTGGYEVSDGKFLLTYEAEALKSWGMLRYVKTMTSMSGRRVAYFELPSGGVLTACVRESRDDCEEGRRWAMRQLLVAELNRNR